MVVKEVFLRGGTFKIIIEQKEGGCTVNIYSLKCVNGVSTNEFIARSNDQNKMCRLEAEVLLIDLLDSYK